jgi:hypothetical protein
LLSDLLSVVLTQQFHQWMVFLIESMITEKTQQHTQKIVELLGEHETNNSECAVRSQDSALAAQERADSTTEVSNFDSNRRCLFRHTSSFKALTHTDASGRNIRVSLIHRSTGLEIHDVRSVMVLVQGVWNLKELVVNFDALAGTKPGLPKLTPDEEKNQTAEETFALKLKHMQAYNKRLGGGSSRSLGVNASWGETFDYYRKKNCFESSKGVFDAAPPAARALFQQTYWQSEARATTEQAQQGALVLVLCSSHCEPD